ncbi:MAG: hypothetical protein PWR27_792 [Petroclostridium sp.]|jgi:cytoskeletal protein CcmA (bactofilin family)|uniref:bactofilin family protein n=1 Tax=Petroclostridium xylanilyticum TaxID=1792311 RepID=UPI000B9814FB|nr:polymer-forming cytoskeletal protein [Petroclostridium xylanilyticum]MBZ4644990.1 hypothetical protein [Clostridia bacterium]MDK2810083.1 hypothetical protein [Petroclostridium sp.]
MFSKKSSSSYSVDTLIGANSFFEGNIKLDGTIRIDGKTRGEVKAEGDVIIGEKATVWGNIYANNVIISGIVEGNITAKGQLRLTTSAKLTGDIKTNSLIADEGAIFHGNCAMMENSTRQEIPTKEKDK